MSIFNTQTSNDEVKYYSKVEVEELVTRLVSDMEEKHQAQFTIMVNDFNKAILSSFNTAANYEYEVARSSAGRRGMSYTGPQFMDKVKDMIQIRFERVVEQARIKSVEAHSKTYDRIVKSQVESNGFIKDIVTEINARQLKVGD